MKRPGGVTFVGWLLGFQALTLCLAAPVLLLAGPEFAEAFESLGIGVGSLTVIGFITLVDGLALFLWATPGATEFCGREGRPERPSA